MDYRSSDAALLVMVQNWIGGKGLNLTAKAIGRFMDHTAPVVRGAMPVPTSTSPCITFRGGRYINTWRNTFLPPCAEAVNEFRDPLTLLMRVIRENLCGQDGELSLDEMITAAQGDDPGELQFRFLMSFLAAPLQAPGTNLQVNMWLLGMLRGSARGCSPR